MLSARASRLFACARLDNFSRLTAAKAQGGMKFSYLLWPGRVLIEMKSRGEKLEKHYGQPFNY